MNNKKVGLKSENCSVERNIDRINAVYNELTNSNIGEKTCRREMPAQARGQDKNKKNMMMKYLTISLVKENECKILLDSVIFQQIFESQNNLIFGFYFNIF